MHTRDGAQENIRKLVDVGVDVIVIVSCGFYYGQMTYEGGTISGGVHKLLQGIWQIGL
jgi:hypothetical protein